MAYKTLKRIAKNPITRANDEHLGSGNCKKVMDSLLVPPAAISGVDITAAPLKVGKGNICRIRVTSTTFILFGASTMTVPVGSEPNSLELFSAGVYMVVAADDYIMASVNPARLEIIDATLDKYGTANPTANVTY